MILEITQLSGAPKPAREPVSGWIQPIVMALVPPDPDPDPEPLMLELHASSRPPAPTANAPAPNALSTLRRPIPAAAAGGPAAAPGAAESGDGCLTGSSWLSP